jgi:hypothetical protein
MLRMKIQMFMMNIWMKKNIKKKNIKNNQKELILIDVKLKLIIMENQLQVKF